MPIRGAFMFRFRRIDMTQCGAARDVFVLCHVSKLGPREGFGRSPLRVNKTVVLHIVIYDRFAKTLWSSDKSRRMLCKVGFNEDNVHHAL